MSSAAKKARLAMSLNNLLVDANLKSKVRGLSIEALQEITDAVMAVEKGARAKVLVEILSKPVVSAELEAPVVATGQAPAVVIPELEAPVGATVPAPAPAIAMPELAAVSEPSTAPMVSEPSEPSKPSALKPKQLRIKPRAGPVASSLPVEKCILHNLKLHIVEKELTEIRGPTTSLCGKEDLDAVINIEPCIMLIDVFPCKESVYPVSARLMDNRTLRDVIDYIASAILKINADNLCGISLPTDDSWYVINEVVTHSRYIYAKIEKII